MQMETHSLVLFSTEAEAKPLRRFFFCRVYVATSLLTRLLKRNCDGGMHDFLRDISIPFNRISERWRLSFAHTMKEAIRLDYC